MKNLQLILISFFISSLLFAQSKDTLKTSNDTLAILKNVSVSAYANEQTKLKDVPSAISLLSKEDLQRFDQVSILSAFNSVAGVNLQERSPGSYLLSIRGSSLRSSFGSANIKMYWDDMPITTAAANISLNEIDISDLKSIEIIKGPPSSLYGASTGGALLLHSNMSNPYNEKDYGYLSIAGGSLQKFYEQAAWRNQGTDFFSGIQQSHLQASGYRDHSGTRKDIFKWTGNWHISPKQTLTILAFYTDFHIQTPGGLTQAQENHDPSQARLRNITDNTSNITKAPFLGITYKSVLSDHFSNTTSLVSTYNSFTNIYTSYAITNTWNYNARTVFKYSLKKNKYNLDLLAGGEILYSNSHITQSGNSNGQPDTIQYNDLSRITQYFFFAQANLSLGKKFSIQTGISRNLTHYWYDRLLDNTSTYPLLEISGPLYTPRVSFLYKVKNNYSLYAVVEKGYSAPTLSEVLPDNGYFNTTLQPEYGWNYETGIKGSFLKNKLDINAAIYYFALQQALVQRQDSNNATYYVNAGSTIQKGLELGLKYYGVNHNAASFIAQYTIYNSLSIQPYYFKTFVSDSSDYSGNKMTGIPRFTNITIIDIKTKDNYFASAFLNCTSAIPLNDSNTVYSKSYQLLQLKFGKIFYKKKYMLSAFAGIDNALDETYSLGNDVNAYGGHYFNPAPSINFFIGTKIEF
jgi:iron complex outermembrane receptor protein